MKVKEKFKRLFTNSNGQVVVIVALLITAVIGMTALVVDMGSLYEDRRTLQGVADAAALAGVQELPESTSAARDTAISNIEKNYYDENDNIIVDIQFDSFMGVPDTKIIVTVSNPDSPVIFGRVYGADSVDIGATATAIVGSPLSYGNHVVPWGLTEGDYEYGQELTLKYGAPPENSPGNFGALRIDPGGANTAYENGIKYGCKTPLEIGDWISVLPGNRVGPTEVGVTGRIALEPDGVWTDPISDLYDDDFNLERYDSQFIIIPIISHWPQGSSGDVQILDFKPFIISNYVPAGGHAFVEGIFLKSALIVTEGGIGGIDQTGIRIIRLIK